MAPMKYCPVCITQKKKNKLIPKQINFRLVAYLCENNSCSYPEGYNFIEVEERSLNEISGINETSVGDEDDLDTWLEDYFGNGNNKQSTTTQGIERSEDGNINDDDLTKIIDEITNTRNENELDLQYDTDIFTWVDNTFQDFSNINNVEHEEETTQCADIVNIVDNFNNIDLDVNKINQPDNESASNVQEINSSLNKLSFKSSEITESETNASIKKPETKIVKNKLPSARILNFEQCFFRAKSDVSHSFKSKLRINKVMTSNDVQSVDNSNRVSNSKLVAKVKKVDVLSAKSHRTSEISKQKAAEDKFKDFSYISVVIKPKCI